MQPDVFGDHLIGDVPAATHEIPPTPQVPRVTELREDMNGRLAELRGEMNGRFVGVNRQFTELRGDMNYRFAAMDQKADRHFTWMVSTQVALLLAVVGALVGAYYR